MSAKSKSIQDKLSDLNQLVAWFDSEEFELEAALDKFKNAEKLAKDIEEDIDKLRNEVVVIKQRFDQ